MHVRPGLQQAVTQHVHHPVARVQLPCLLECVLELSQLPIQLGHVVVELRLEEVPRHWNSELILFGKLLNRELAPSLRASANVGI